MIKYIFCHFNFCIFSFSTVKMICCAVLSVSCMICPLLSSFVHSGFILEMNDTIPECMLPLIIAEYFTPHWELKICQGILIYLGMQSIVLNFTIFRYYSRDRGHNRIIPFLYKITATFDMMTGITGFLNGGYFAILRSDTLTQTLCLPLTDTSSGHVISQRLVLILSSSLSAFMSSATAFLHTLLTVVRCINIVSPFYDVRVESVKRVYWLYLLVIAAVMIADFSYTFYGNYKTELSAESYFYYVIFVRVLSLVKNGMMKRGSSDLTFWLHLVFDLCIPFALPCLVCIVCLAVLVWALNFDKKSPSINHSRDNAASQRRITRTIAMLAAVFVACNSFYITVIAMQRYFNKQQSTQKWHGKAATLGFCLIPLLNSALNPFIFICRSKTLKKFTGAPFNVSKFNKLISSSNGSKAVTFIAAKLRRSDPDQRQNSAGIDSKEAVYTPVETVSTLVKTQTLNCVENNGEGDIITEIK